MKKHKIPVPDQEDLNLIGKYIAGLYRLNYFVVAGYVAANTFESIINIFLEDQGKLDFLCETQKCLDKKIRTLDTSILKKQFNIYESIDDLIDIKYIRNDITHGFIRDIEKEKIQKLVEFVWKVTKISDELELDLIDLKTAQYWVRDFEVITAKNSDKGKFSHGDREITKSDFLDLYKMRHRFLEIEAFLDTTKRLGKYPKYKVDNVSAVNPTSAYVWLAIVDAKTKSRKKIFGPSISILATPVDFRIYLDFGGFAFDDRKRYYQFLQSFDSKKLDIDKDDLYIFDIDWYAFFGEKFSYEKYVDSPRLKEKAEENIQFLKKDNRQAPLSWNKLLIGYVYDREELPEQKLDFDTVWHKVENIIKLYEYFHEVVEELETPKPKHSYGNDTLAAFKQKHKKKK